MPRSSGLISAEIEAALKGSTGRGMQVMLGGRALAFRKCSRDFALVVRIGLSEPLSASARRKARSASCRRGANHGEGTT